ncbi:ribosomal protein L32 [Chloroherpeton thalassium ATCC 35110]|uniref:Large ribosomal subunit protein bL32 n=1 Tax=Chloroherpeton thalassium (strain ATCC 35110 / GB-78) TaxID=517418 RepID=RL32_CHLT3|nr:50S ribosomal protein L32 [Chloroherpeton thalassium]B3QTV3.1 RecName: Full=Large ribosomal subunit protein bL32; AltName: Full=50S ribosomal protein L32 [Chloroherpeton thalassium ATCC 35110]ACF14301.1 ribosomal protein L32 [Chloroherpeton thalassium ATCC 35110]
MAHPKRRISRSRRDKRRAQYNAKTKAPAVATCPVTGQSHHSHRAYWFEGSLYFKGRVVMTKEK